MLFYLQIPKLPTKTQISPFCPLGLYWIANISQHYSCHWKNVQTSLLISIVTGGSTKLPKFHPSCPLELYCSAYFGYHYSSICYRRVYRSCKGENIVLFHHQVSKSRISPLISPFLPSRAVLDDLYYPTTTHFIVERDFPTHQFQCL